MRRACLSLLLAASCAAPAPPEPAAPAPAPPPPPPPPPVVIEGRPAKPPTFTPLAVRTDGKKSAGLAVLEEEVATAIKALRQAKPPAHYLAYSVIDEAKTEISARDGGLVASYSTRRRRLHTDVRVGDRKLDSSHDRNAVHHRAIELPLDDDPQVIRSLAWRQTHERYWQAVALFQKLEKAGTRPDAQGDFSETQPVVHLEPPVALKVDATAWEGRLRRLSARLKAAKLDGAIQFEAAATNRWLLTSEGTVVQAGTPVARVLVSAGGLEQGFEAATAAELPSEAELGKVIEALASDARAASKAAPAERWSGPVLFQPQAAALLAHDLLGHHLEGQRLADDKDAQLLAAKLGQPLFPPFFTVIDDPTIARLGTRLLTGAYAVDDEGVPAERVTLIEGGVLRGLLLDRRPVPGFPRSNGHARRGEWRGVFPRQSNLVVSPTHALDVDELKKRLVELAKRQGKDHGLLVRDADGIFEWNTDPPRFGLRLVRAQRVFTDGRPDQPVRGAVVTGKPQEIFAHLVAASDDYQAVTFGCYGDSGLAPGSATSPSLLFDALEIQPSQHWLDR